MLFGPPNTLSIEYQWLFVWEKSGRNVKLITLLHVVQTSELHFFHTPASRDAVTVE
jgi:hypothetical protein